MSGSTVGLFQSGFQKIPIQETGVHEYTSYQQKSISGISQNDCLFVFNQDCTQVASCENLATSSTSLKYIVMHSV